MARRSLRVRLLALAASGVLAIGVGEVLVRWLLGPVRPLGQLSFRDTSGALVGEPGREDLVLQHALRAGLVELLPADQTPRPRQRFAPGASFLLCYGDQDRLRCEWLDERGCVEVKINRYGLRERDTITPDNKAAGERRIVCIGDSFTFGWGIPVEKGWVRRLEEVLRSDGTDVRTVNCGASGALCVDEYWWGLRTRFAAFDPDLVLVAICLNDLLPSSGLYVAGPTRAPTGFLLLDHLRQAFSRSPLDLDPSVDWVGLLLDLPREAGEAAGLYGPDKPFEGMWSQGSPQAALVAMRDYCAQRNVGFGVILWPFLQGLGEPGRYPLRRMHELVADHCAATRIAFLDLLPDLELVPARQLWVTPADMHANPRAQELVLPSITRFARQLLTR